MFIYFIDTWMATISDKNDSIKKRVRPLSVVKDIRYSRVSCKFKCLQERHFI